MRKKDSGVYYGDYLQLDKLLGAQKTISGTAGKEAHEETLFIIVHQVYELWFKQILHEFKSIMAVFDAKENIEESILPTLVERLERVKKIQALMLPQFDVLETMTPMDFLEFRDLLIPASGFQSAQFRKIEIIMGLSTADRTKVEREFFLGRLDKKDQEELLALEKKPSLLNHIEKWLERMPFTYQEQFNFWDEYKKAVNAMLDKDDQIIQSNVAQLSEKQRQAQLANINSTRETFDNLFDTKKYDELLKSKKKRLSQKATLNALFILLFRNEPILSWPCRLITSLMDIDESLTTWRYRHSLMAHRMLGTKIGTGGSSGHEYLKMAADNNRVYNDIFDLSTFIIPKGSLPKIPDSLKTKMNLAFCES